MFPVPHRPDGRGLPSRMWRRKRFVAVFRPRRRRAVDASVVSDVSVLSLFSRADKALAERFVRALLVEIVTEATKRRAGLGGVGRGDTVSILSGGACAHDDRLLRAYQVDTSWRIPRRATRPAALTPSRSFGGEGRAVVGANGFLVRTSEERQPGVSHSLRPECLASARADQEAAVCVVTSTGSTTLPHRKVALSRCTIARSAARHA